MPSRRTAALLPSLGAGDASLATGRQVVGSVPPTSSTKPTTSGTAPTSRGEAPERRLDRGDERRLVDEVLGRVAAERELRRLHEVRPGGDGLAVPVRDQLHVPPDVPDQRGQLQHRQPHRATSSVAQAVAGGATPIRRVILAGVVGGPDDLTAVWREALVVLGRAPLTVAGLAEALGVTRRTAQRRADALVRRGYAEYLPNAAHRRARLVQVTDPSRPAPARLSRDGGQLERPSRPGPSRRGGSQQLAPA